MDISSTGYMQLYSGGKLNFDMTPLGPVAHKCLKMNDVMTSVTASYNSFFRDSSRSGKLSYKGTGGGITVIEA